MGGFPSLLFSEAWSGSIGGGLAIGGVRVCFVSGLDGFAVFGTRVAGVGWLGEDEGELERIAYCTGVRGQPSGSAASVAGAGNTSASVTAVSGRRFGKSLGLVSNMTAPSLVVLSMNPSGSMRGAGMMSLFLSMEKGRLKACPVVAVGCLSFDRADRGPRRL